MKHLCVFVSPPRQLRLYNKKESRAGLHISLAKESNLPAGSRSSGVNGFCCFAASRISNTAEEHFNLICLIKINKSVWTVIRWDVLLFKRVRRFQSDHFLQPLMHIIGAADYWRSALIRQESRSAASAHKSKAYVYINAGLKGHDVRTLFSLTRAPLYST